MYFINDAVELLIDRTYSFDEFLIHIEYVDLTQQELSTVNFSRLFDRVSNNNNLDDINIQIKILNKLIEKDLDLNHIPKNNQFAYGHILLRSCRPELIRIALDNGFRFNSYTTQPKWHSLELIQLNYMSVGSNKKELLDIISTQLEKGINLSETNAQDFLNKLNRGYVSIGWLDLYNTYINDDYLGKYFVKHSDIIIKNNFLNLISKETQDIFIF